MKCSYNYGMKTKGKIDEKYNVYSFYVNGIDIYTKKLTKRAANSELNKLGEIIENLDFNNLLVK